MHGLRWDLTRWVPGPTAGQCEPKFLFDRCNRAPGTPCPKGEVKEK